MNLNEFKKALKMNQEKTVSELNAYLKTLSKPTEDFNNDNSVYDFSWTSLRQPLILCGLKYSRKNVEWGYNEDETENEIQEDNNMSVLEKKIIDNIQNGNGIEKVSTTIRLPKTVSERIEKIVENNDNYSRNQLITDLVEIGLERIEQHLNN